MTDSKAQLNRLDARVELAAKGVVGTAAEALLNATGRERHSARARHFLSAALQEWCRVTNQETIPPEQDSDAAAYAIAVILLDCFGPFTVGGPSATNSRAHHRAFRQDCGARTGPKSGATYAAASCAIHDLWRRALPSAHRDYPLTIVIRPSADRDGISFCMSDAVDVVIRIEPTPDCDAQPPAWVRAVALEGLRRALGETSWFRVRGEREPQEHEVHASWHPFDFVSFAGDATAWATVVEQIVKRDWTDRVGYEIKAFARDTHVKAPLFWLPPHRPTPLQRPSLAFLNGWIERAVDDEARASQAIALATIDQEPTQGQLQAELGRIFVGEIEWFKAARAMATPGILGEVGGSQDDCALVLIMLGSATAGHWWWIQPDAEDQEAEAVTEPSCATLMGYTERFVHGLRELHGDPALSPEDGLGLHVGTSGGIYLDALAKRLAPFSGSTVQKMFLPLVEHVLHELEVLRLVRIAGVRVVGTIEEWRSLRDAIAQSA